MRYLLLFIINLISIPFSYSAVMNVYTDQRGTVIMNLDGEIKYGDGNKFVYIAESWRHSGNPIQIIVLSSNGGSVGAADVISRYILNYNIATMVFTNSYCYSSCFNIFISGNPRFANVKSSIGVHRMSIASQDTDSARSSSIDMSSYYKAMNIPDNIRLAMLETPPSQMYYLTEIDKKNISTLIPNVNDVIEMFNNVGVTIPQTSVSKNDKAKARKLNMEAIALIRNEGNFIDAIQKLEQAKSLSPSDSEILGNLGYAYSNTGNTEQAQINFTASLKITPRRGATWGNLAPILADKGMIDWAVEAFINYWNYSKNKDAATKQLYYWSDEYPNSNRDLASSTARRKLGID